MSCHLTEFRRALQQHFSGIQLCCRSRKFHQCFGAIPIFLGCGHQSASQRELEGEVRQISVNGSVSEITREPISKLLTVCATASCEG